MNKSVWRMNTGNGDPADRMQHGAVMYGYGVVCYEGYSNYNWFIDSDDCYPIIAYQTTRIRKAKYEQIYCEECGYSGQRLNENYDKLIKCPHCNGKGYTLEAVK